MRVGTAAIGILLTLLHGVAIAQQGRPPYAPDALVAPHTTPIAVDEPWTLPPAATLQAKPMPEIASPPLGGGSRVAQSNRIQPPVNFRLASAEQAVVTTTPTRPLRLAPRSEANRLGPGQSKKPASISPGSAIGTVAGSLGAVLGLFLVVAWCTRRFAPAGSTLLPKEVVELLGRAPLTARQQIQLIRIGNKLLLVAFSPVGVGTLTEISEPTEVEHLVSLCRRGQTGSSSAAFRQALAQFANEPTERGFVGASRGSS